MNWSLIDRNVIGDGDAYLRAGPSMGQIKPPMGDGSLGLHAGNAKEQDASTEARWYFTGGTGTDTGCNEVTY